LGTDGQKAAPSWLRNLQKVSHAAAICGIRYFSIDEAGDDGLIFQSFFEGVASNLN
jgi:hypothetical protein